MKSEAELIYEMLRDMSETYETQSTIKIKPNKQPKIILDGGGLYGYNVEYEHTTLDTFIEAAKAHHEMKKIFEDLK